MIGQTINQFRIEEEIAQGGMGIVYKAYDTTLDRHVAIKLIKTKNLEKSLSEAKALASFTQDNIVPIYEAGEWEGKVYLVLAYIQDGLTAMDASRRLSMDETIHAMHIVAKTLRDIHAKGIIHRDIKPDNILFKRTADGYKPLITDFGISKRISESDHDEGPSGTIEFMAPEQILGASPTPAFDVYSFGVTLFTLLTGEPPLKDGGSIEDIVYTPIPRLRTFIKSIPKPLEKLVTRSCEKEAAKRYETMDQVLECFDEFYDPPKWYRNPWVMSAAVIPILIGLWFFFSAQSETHPVVFIKPMVGKEMFDQLRDKLLAHNYEVLSYSDSKKALFHYQEFEVKKPIFEFLNKFYDATWVVEPLIYPYKEDFRVIFTIINREKRKKFAFTGTMKELSDGLMKSLSDINYANKIEYGLPPKYFRQKQEFFPDGTWGIVSGGMFSHENLNTETIFRWAFNSDIVLAKWFPQYDLYVFSLKDVCVVYSANDPREVQFSGEFEILNAFNIGGTIYLHVFDGSHALKIYDPKKKTLKIAEFDPFSYSTGFEDISTENYKTLHMVGNKRTKIFTFELAREIYKFEDGKFCILKKRDIGIIGSHSDLTLVTKMDLIDDRIIIYSQEDNPDFSFSHEDDVYQHGVIEKFFETRGGHMKRRTSIRVMDWYGNFFDPELKTEAKNTLGIFNRQIVLSDIGYHNQWVTWIFSYYDIDTLEVKKQEGMLSWIIEDLENF